MLRLGTVPYLVARPLDDGLERDPTVELVRDVPARLIASLRAGALDVALVSAVELFRQPGYRFLDGWAVAGRGRVSSVQVFLRRPLAEVASVALDPASRAGAALTEIVWPGKRPRFLAVLEGADPRAAAADAWLRIGDEALRETYEPGARPTFNPAERWCADTGLPFPFAVWVVRPGVDAEPAVAACARARARGAARLATFAAEVEARLGVPREAAQRYFEEEIDYAPGAELAQALAAFQQRAAALGLARADLAPSAVPTPAAKEGACRG
jgi:chorismate dehydratase